MKNPFRPRGWVKEIEGIYRREWPRDIVIPVIASVEYGNPLFAVEFIIKGSRFRAILVRFTPPGMDGYYVWRKIKCDTPAVEIGNKTRWNIFRTCADHPGMPVLEFYPPTDAECLIISNLNSCVATEFTWELFAPGLDGGDKI